MKYSHTKVRRKYKDKAIYSWYFVKTFCVCVLFFPTLPLFMFQKCWSYGFFFCFKIGINFNKNLKKKKSNIYRAWWLTRLSSEFYVMFAKNIMTIMQLFYNIYHFTNFLLCAHTQWAKQIEYKAINCVPELQGGWNETLTAQHT